MRGGYERSGKEGGGGREGGGGKGAGKRRVEEEWSDGGRRIVGGMMYDVAPSQMV